MKQRKKNENDLQWHLFSLLVVNYPSNMNPNDFLDQLTALATNRVFMGKIKNRQMTMNGLGFSVDDKQLYDAFLKLHGKNGLFVFRFPGKFKSCESELRKIFTHHYNQANNVLDLSNFTSKYHIKPSRRLPCVSLNDSCFIEYLFFRLSEEIKGSTVVVKYIDMSNNGIQEIDVDRIITFIPTILAFNFKGNPLKSRPISQKNPQLVITCDPIMQAANIPDWANPQPAVPQWGMQQQQPQQQWGIPQPQPQWGMPPQQQPQWGMPQQPQPQWSMPQMANPMMQMPNPQIGAQPQMMGMQPQMSSSYPVGFGVNQRMQMPSPSYGPQFTGAFGASPQMQMPAPMMGMPPSPSQSQQQTPFSSSFKAKPQNAFKPTKSFAPKPFKYKSSQLPPPPQDDPDSSIYSQYPIL